MDKDTDARATWRRLAVPRGLDCIERAKVLQDLVPRAFIGRR